MQRHPIAQFTPGRRVRKRSGAASWILPGPVCPVEFAPRGLAAVRRISTPGVNQTLRMYCHPSVVPAIKLIAASGSDVSYISSTVGVPDVGAVPRHIAVIMDGNGRWAARRKLPRIAGHTKGVEAVRMTVEGCAKRGIGYLTLFAFSSENWRRPRDEVSFLMRLFASVLERETDRLDKNGIRLCVVGDLSMFDAALQLLIQRAEAKTAQNSRMTLTVAANYGGRWGVPRT